MFVWLERPLQAEVTNLWRCNKVARPARPQAFPILYKDMLLNRKQEWLDGQARNKHGLCVRVQKGSEQVQWLFMDFQMWRTCSGSITQQNLVITSKRFCSRGRNYQSKQDASKLHEWRKIQDIFFYDTKWLKSWKSQCHMTKPNDYFENLFYFWNMWLKHSWGLTLLGLGSFTGSKISIPISNIIHQRNETDILSPLAEDHAWNQWSVGQHLVKWLWQHSVTC